LMRFRQCFEPKVATNHTVATPYLRDVSTMRVIYAGVSCGVGFRLTFMAVKHLVDT
jgi:hypothetical protein